VDDLGLSSVETFGSAEAMCREAENSLDAVVIASHTSDHARHALPFVEAHIPVYLEKPLTGDLLQAFDFVAAIGRDEHLLQIGLQRRYDPALLYARELIERGLIGSIRELRCVLRDQFPPPPTYRSPGLIFDMGIHVADEAMFFLDEFPDEVWASAHHTKTYNNPIDLDGDTAFVTFTTPSRVVGRLDVSRTHASGYNNETYIIGTEGTLHVGRFAGYPGPINVEVWKSDGSLHPGSTTFPMTTVEGPTPEFLPRFDTAYREAHQAFRESVRCGSPFRVTQNHVLDAQVMVEAAHRSAQDRGKPYRTTFHEDLPAYRNACIGHGLIEV
jgi:myo-inositol 2-dehydrogenase / D-chiro-inositol 1-dehydrogenase